MDFTPLSDEQIRALNLFPEGRYRFRVLRTEQKRSQAGSDYFNLKLNIVVDGKDKTIFDMLFFEGKMIFKTKHFCEVTGMASKYDSGKLMPAECDNQTGWLELTHRVNTKTGELQNNVRDYVHDEVDASAPAPVDDFLDDVPSFT